MSPLVTSMIVSACICGGADAVFCQTPGSSPRGKLLFSIGICRRVPAAQRLPMTQKVVHLKVRNWGPVGHFREERRVQGMENQRDLAI